MDIPEGIPEAPNAEHHSFTNSHAHINGVGSMFASGTFDARDRFKTKEHGYAIGTGLPWERVFETILKELIVSDGGGITINHPVLSKLSFDEVTKMLDYDSRVLGIEIYSDPGEQIDCLPRRKWKLQLIRRIKSAFSNCPTICGSSLFSDSTCRAWHLFRLQALIVKPR